MKIKLVKLDGDNVDPYLIDLTIGKEYDVVGSCSNEGYWVIDDDGNLEMVYHGEYEVVE